MLGAKINTQGTLALSIYFATRIRYRSSLVAMMYTVYRLCDISLLAFKTAHVNYEIVIRFIYSLQYLDN